MRDKKILSASEIRIRDNKIRRKKELHKNIVLSLLTICIVFILAFTVTSFLSKAKELNEPTFYKYYTSISVKSGDTLWSIAKEHMGNQYKNLDSYINEVMQINALQEENITAGQSLVIPYYSTEFVG